MLADHCVVESDDLLQVREYPKNALFGVACRAMPQNILWVEVQRRRGPI
jgi:hypothetical protein